MDDTLIVVASIMGLIVGVGVAVLVILFVSTLGGQTINLVQDNLDTIGVTQENQNRTIVTGGAGYTLQCAPILLSSFTARNASASGTLISSGNYTLNVATAKFNLTSAQYNNSNIFFDFECGDDTIRTTVENSIISAFEANEKTSQYLPIIILAVVLFLVLSLVVGFGGLTRSGGANAL